MPRATMLEEAEYSLPAGEFFPARLESVKEREIRFFKKDEHGNKTNEESSFTKWVWEFQITEGPYTGLRAWGETEDRLTSREDNLVRQWGEALLNAEIRVGDEFDTDAVVGLPCVITVRHDAPRTKRDGGKFFPCPVDEVLPAAGAEQELAPPF